MKLTIEDKTLHRCEVGERDYRVALEIPDEVEVIADGAFDGVGSRLMRLVMPFHLRKVERDAFAGLGFVDDLTVYSYDDEDVPEILDGDMFPIACEKLTVLHGPRGDLFDLCFTGGSFRHLVIDEGVTLRFVPAHEIDEYVGFGLESVETLQLLVSGDIWVQGELFGNTALKEGLRRLVFVNCAGMTEQGELVRHKGGCEEALSPLSCTFVTCPDLEGMGPLQEVVLPEGLTHIPDGLFAWCRHLRHVQVPLSVHSIGHRAFAGCSELGRLVLPGKALAHAASDAFVECPQLTEVEAFSSYTEEMPRDWRDGHTRHELIDEVIPLDDWVPIRRVDEAIRFVETQFPEVRAHFERAREDWLDTKVRLDEGDEQTLRMYDGESGARFPSPTETYRRAVYELRGSTSPSGWFSRDRLWRDRTLSDEEKDLLREFTYLLDTLLRAPR